MTENEPPTVKPRYQEHPRMFADEPGWFVVAVVVIAAGLVGVGIVYAYVENPGPWLALSPLALSLAGVGWLLVWYSKNRCTLVTVGDERILLSRGVFAKERVEVELSSIRTVEVEQTLVDRIFNVGILKIFTAGDKPELQQGGMPEPERLRSALRA
jgi:uncharacterized membrane protein YdbT with pleckstrin-like domain